ncbi:MAG: NAD(P)H-hydrate dehydratase [Candidatus Aenigmarchaeota archaeon]|nr:NAD(P)H-hydrate dehydratase [Candidatus Aenigmarchaeota archaeon]
MKYIEKTILKEIYKKRDLWARKHDFGNLLIIGGSRLYPTTPILSALSAYRSGVDWVTIAAPEEACKIIASYSPNLMVHPLEGEYLTKKHVDELIELTNKRSAISIGGGMTRESSVLGAIVEFLERIDKPCVIDDDAIYAVARKKRVLRDKKFVILPHSFEFYILSGIKVSTNLKERINAIERVASQLKTTILLKGHIDVISDGKETRLNKTGSAYMTKQGFGNTLAGICAAILARNINPFISACAAAYINGKAGELTAKKYHEGMLPTDLIEHIPIVIKEGLK